jgi:hypothetical protein
MNSYNDIYDKIPKNLKNKSWELLAIIDMNFYFTLDFYDFIIPFF